jgi:anthranilate phosphoribosyltransferase
MIREAIAHLVTGKHLTADEAEAVMNEIMSGEATPAQIGSFLTALRVKGETVDEIAGCVRAMRANAIHVRPAAKLLVDTAGTGGDGAHTYNISTTAAFVIAGAGVSVAKHGNRAVSSKAGSADMLAALGVNIEADYGAVEHALHEAGITFMLAPRFHSAMRNVAAARVEMGVRTIFNLLGPISNPAEVRRLLVGVFARKWIEPIAMVLRNLGCERAWVVHGADGLDEMTLTGPTHVAELRDGVVRTFEVTPEDAGLPRRRAEELKGGDAAENAASFRAILAGKTGALRDFVLYNAAAALIIAGRCEDLRTGVLRAAEAIDNGKAQRALDQLILITARAPD